MTGLGLARSTLVFGVVLLGLSSASTVCAGSTTPGHGYWLAAVDGGVFAFGDAPFLGSLSGTRLNEPVVGLAPTPTGQGYWLAAADGGVFAFGDAPFLGTRRTESSACQTPSCSRAGPVVDVASHPREYGFWLLARSGATHAFGAAEGEDFGCIDAACGGAISSSASGTGYVVAQPWGTVTSSGEVPRCDGLNGVSRQPIVGIALTNDNAGCWLVANDGGVFTTPEAPFLGSLGGTVLQAPVVGIAALPAVSSAQWTI
jgi:hypothetical protein